MARSTAPCMEILWTCVRVIAESTLCPVTGYAEGQHPFLFFLYCPYFRS